MLQMTTAAIKMLKVKREQDGMPPTAGIRITECLEGAQRVIRLNFQTEAEAADHIIDDGVGLPVFLPRQLVGVLSGYTLDVHNTARGPQLTLR